MILRRPKLSLWPANWSIDPLMRNTEDREQPSMGCDARPRIAGPSPAAATGHPARTRVEGDKKSVSRNGPTTINKTALQEEPKWPSRPSPSTSRRRVLQCGCGGAESLMSTTSVLTANSGVQGMPGDEVHGRPRGWARLSAARLDTGYPHICQAGGSRALGIAVGPVRDFPSPGTWMVRRCSPMPGTGIQSLPAKAVNPQSVRLKCEIRPGTRDGSLKRNSRMNQRYDSVARRSFAFARLAAGTTGRGRADRSGQPPVVILPGPHRAATSGRDSNPGRPLLHTSKAVDDHLKMVVNTSRFLTLDKRSPRSRSTTRTCST